VDDRLIELPHDLSQQAQETVSGNHEKRECVPPWFDRGVLLPGQIGVTQ
jgi:hypothetical protein